ncbi:hypothetical protein JCM8547_003393 [Rhodosporidiobolus lusitaniae]
MSGIADTIKSTVESVTGSTPSQYERGYAPNAEAEVAAQGGKDARPPGKQYALAETPIDDVYADGKPYRGVGKLEGKAVLITGGDSGIGRATAILAAIEGANVAIAYLPAEQKDAESVKEYIAQKTGKQTLLLPLDLKAESNCIQAVDRTVQEFGRLDVLFNNAAQQLQNESILTLDSKQWEDTFQVNIHHAFYTSKAAVPHLEKTKGTIIINASVNAFIGRPDLLDYTSTKGALVAFMRGLANQLAEKDIRVNAVAPGPIYTPLVTSTFTAENIKGVKDGPLGRPGQPFEIAAPVIFLASQDASYITGNTLHINGGQYVH